MDLLEELNRLRAIDGKVALKQWTGNEDQLKKAIMDRRRAQTPQKTDEQLIAEYRRKGGDIKYGRSASARGVRRQGGNRPFGRKSKIQDKSKIAAVAEKQTRRATAIPSDCFHLIEIEDTPGTILRTRARKIPELATLNVKELGRWVFRRSDWDRVCDLMRKRR